MVRLVKQRNLEPVIVFSFSKKECEVYALKMAEHDFLTGMLRRFIENACLVLYITMYKPA